MRSRLLVLVALGAALVALPTAALGSSARGASNSMSFPDSLGEDPNAPDITSVDVSNDDAGNITFKINISNRPALTSDMVLFIDLDTDNNPATGDPQGLGTDYSIQLISGAVELFQWNGSSYTAAASQASLTFAYDATGATIRISAADLGKTKAFNFDAVAVSGLTFDAMGNPVFTNAHADLAPDAGHGLFSYKVLTKLTLSVTAFTVAPRPAKAGKNFAAVLAANESDTGGPVQTGTVACSAAIGAKHIAALSHGVVNGIAGCIWHIPKLKTRGKTIHGTITLTVQGVTVTRSFSAKIT